MCDKTCEECGTLLPEDENCYANGTFFFDESGALVTTEAATVPGLIAQPIGTTIQPISPISLYKPCSLATLNGSWLLEIQSQMLTPFQVRGPMRIESRNNILRISGDIYVKPMLIKPTLIAAPIVSTTAGLGMSATTVTEPLIPGTLVIQANWYPAYPQSEYRWYFRSLGCSYDTKTGKLTFKFERHLWNTATQEFTSKDNGWMTFECTRSIVNMPTLPAPTIKMSGTAEIGGRKYQVIATKTSPYYRGCKVEVDVMKNRSYPDSATSCDGTKTYTFTSVYREAGMDFQAVVNQTDIPEDPLLTTAEMHSLLSTYRSVAPTGDAWRLWLLVGSSMDGTLGIMFDIDNPPHREGAVAFYDPRFGTQSYVWPPAQNKKIGEVPLAFLRTLIHEAGHAFNLFHPKHDVHGVAVDKTIMNQTGDVMGFATAADPYPCNAIMAFNDHCAVSLIHSPDPQVKPGWKEFGWGHGSVWSGIAEPVDAMGLDLGAPEAEDLRLELDLPKELHRGEYVVASVAVVNTGKTARRVSSAINLSEGDLRVHIKPPTGAILDVRDVVLACGERRTVDLGPGMVLSGNIQLFYTNHGFVFDQPGRYELQAELEVGDGTVIRSGRIDVVVRPAMTDAERIIQSNLMDADVGLSIALGDFGSNTDVQRKLTAVAEACSDTTSGAAAAMVVANSLARPFRDPRTRKILRNKDETEAARLFDIAVKDRSAEDVARLATSVVSPREVSAPLLDFLRIQVKKGRKDGTYMKGDADLADQILSDHLA